MVSCLNCPKVAENESGGHVAERILNSYLQLRTKYWTTPEAVFEIVGAGSEIPLGFTILRSDDSLTLEGPWIGIAICAVIALHHIDVAMKTKYVVTTYIHVGEKYWRIPVPINFLAAGLENQLVFYWTRSGDLQRTVDSSQKNTFTFSFSVEPQDCKLQVAKFGVRFIKEKDILQLKKLDDSTSKLVRSLLNQTTERQRYKLACEPVRYWHSLCTSIKDDIFRSRKFIHDYRNQQYTLGGMHKFTKRLTEINREFLSECKEKWSHPELFPLVYHYYQIIHGTSELYNEFLRLLKDACDSWLSVKMALEQIVAKSRTSNGYSYREMLEQLNDLEAAEGIRFCATFITSFAFMCQQTLSFSKHLEESNYIEKPKSMIALEKVSYITIKCIVRIMAEYMCTDKPKCSRSYFMSLDSSDRIELFPAMRNYGRDLHIWDFLGGAVVVQELKMKMARFASFTRQNEEMMMIVINKLEKMTENILVTIEDMGRNAHLYSLDIREAGITLNQFIVDSNLQMFDTRVRFMPPNEEQQYENPLCEARAILYKATLSLINTDLQWYICACEEEADDSSLLSCHSIGHDNTSNIINIICDPHSITRGYSLDGIHKLITCLDSINQEGFTVLSECKEEWRHHPRLFHLVNDYHKICLQTSLLYNELVRLLKGKLDSLLCVSLRWKEFVVNLVQDDYYQNYKEMTLHLNDDGRLTLSSDFKKSFAYICKHTVTFTRQFEEALQDLKPVKVLAKVSSGLIAGVFGVMAAYMVDLGPFQWMEVKTFTCVWLHLIRSFPWNSLLWKHKPMIIKEFFDIDSLLREAKHIMEDFCLASKEDVMIVIDTAAEKMGKLSVTIEEMSRHAQKCSDDVIKAGKTLELISRSHMLPIKRKR